ncbi:MAG: DUF4363 family protein [Ruminococcaceae bacterium]|nr:DUF4363 family protein [Oscillospiraceae bacterium]
MGKRFWTGVILAILLPLGGFFSVRYLYRTQLPLSKTMASAAAYLQKSSPQKALVLTEEASRTWKKREKIVQAMSEHRLPEQIREEFDRLFSQLSAQEYAHAQETAQALSQLFETLGTAQLPHWWNFF